MFDDIITDVLKAEGWDTYTNRLNDRGGPTKWGITLKAWEAYVGHSCTEDDIKTITQTQARVFYEEEYVRAPRFNLLPEPICSMVVDCGVNHGPRAASKWVQRAVGARQDGHIGPNTIAAVEATNPLTTYLRICAFRMKLYGRIVTKDPTQAENAWGWNNRAAKWVILLADRISGS